SGFRISAPRWRDCRWSTGTRDRNAGLLACVRRRRSHFRHGREILLSLRAAPAFAGRRPALPATAPLDATKAAESNRVRQGILRNYHVELSTQRGSLSAPCVFERLALPIPVSISNGICSG